MTQTAKRCVGGVIATVCAAIILLGLNAQMTHYATASETDARAKRNEASIAPIIELVKVLGDRQEAKDAKLERDAELCTSGILKDCGTCAAAGKPLESCSR